MEMSGLPHAFVCFMFWSLYFMEEKKIAVPTEQDIGLATETVWTRRRRKSVTCSNLTTTQHNIYITNCIFIYNYYGI
jgi:hypothetical protein